MTPATPADLRLARQGQALQLDFGVLYPAEDAAERVKLRAAGCLGEARSNQ